MSAAQKPKADIAQVFCKCSWCGTPLDILVAEKVAEQIKADVIRPYCCGMCRDEAKAHYK